MGKGQEPFRRAATVKIGALVAVLVLTLLVPTLAFAANVATFSSKAPAAGSVSAVSMPKISVVVYDRYGVRGSSNYRIYLDGVRKYPSIYRYSGYGYKKFKLSYQVPAALGNGVHTATAWVKDTAGHISKSSWTFTVDTVAPVTTMLGTLPQFINPYASPSVVSGPLFLSAVDSGSGVAQTYFSIDGGAPVAGVLAWYSFATGNHTVAYWSVDKAGNVETHHTVSTYVASGHSLPAAVADSSCLATGCHGGAASVLAIHAGVAPSGCPCHAATTLTNDCVTCHSGGNAPANHATHLSIESSATPGSATDCVVCHGAVLIGSTGIHATCATCHNPANTESGPGAHAAAAIAAGGAHCESCHDTFAATHTGANASHTKAGACYASTCHGTDVTKMHTTDFRGSGETPPGCAACHNEDTNLSVVGTNCNACHVNIEEKHNFIAAHAEVKAAFDTNSGGCVSCHGDDFTKVMLVKPRTSGVPTSTTGYDEHKGCSCHAYGEAAGKTACQDCHGEIGDPEADHPYHVGYHDVLAANIIDSPSSACAACHGSDVEHVGSRLVSGGDVSVPASLTAPVQEHRNCSCHVYHEVTVGGGQACADCHKNQYAPHGFAQGNASGHNTTAYGTVGAKTKFDGTQGVTLTWEVTLPGTITVTPAAGPSGYYSVGTTGVVQTTWNLPTANVFWGSEDPSAPPTAKTGLNWDSVITCQDCHTGLNVAGPHGAAQNWGLDPNYPGDYSYAELTKYVTCNSQYVPTDMSEPNRTNYLTPLSASGIAMRSTLATAAPLITRTDGTKGASAVICAKCHDLENRKRAYDPGQGETSLTVGTSGQLYDTVEGANTAHDSHHQDDVNGSAQCVNCHIGVPHGWKVPRLLVDTEEDVAPYNDPDHLGLMEGGAWSREGMLSLSAINEHPLGAATGTDPYSARDGSAVSTLNIAHIGYAYWNEGQCQACGDHNASGAVGPRIVRPGAGAE